VSTCYAIHDRVLFHAILVLLTRVFLFILDCTEELVGPLDRCENVLHLVTLLDAAVLSQTQVADFESALMAAITRGDLQANLPEGSLVTILTGLAIPPVVPASNIDPLVPDVDSGLSGGATAGIVLASLAVTILPICFYVAMRNSHDVKEPYGGYEPHDAGSVEGMDPEMDVESTPKGEGMVVAAAASIGTGTLGASPSDYGKNYHVKDVSVSSSSTSSQHIQQVQKVPPLTPERDGPPDARSFDDHDSSSNAGSSGWSSSAGLSSLNTGSAEDSMDLLNSPQGSTLAAIGAASAVARRMDNRRKITV
jgi:hypothetical protein